MAHPIPAPARSPLVLTPIFSSMMKIPITQVMNIVRNRMVGRNFRNMRCSIPKICFISWKMRPITFVIIAMMMNHRIQIYHRSIQVSVFGWNRNKCVSVMKWYTTITNEIITHQVRRNQKYVVREFPLLNISTSIVSYFCVLCNFWISLAFSVFSVSSSGPFAHWRGYFVSYFICIFHEFPPLAHTWI